MAKKLFLIVILFLSPFIVLAKSSPDVFLNEIMWGKDNQGEEWIELRNIGKEDVNLSGWLIDNAKSSGKPLNIESGIIQPKGYFLICDNDSKKDYCDVYDSISLANDYKSNGKLILKNKTQNKDQTPDPSSSKWTSGKSTNISMQRALDVNGALSDDWVDGDPPTPKGSGIFLTANAGKALVSLVNKEITFDASESIGNIKEFTWNFGDGFTGQGKKVVHSYDLAGKYIVSLKISDGRKEDKTNIEVAIYSDSIYISEFSPKEKWVEIVNTSNNVQDISGWGISGKKETIDTVFPDNTFISANSFLIFHSVNSILKKAGSTFLFYPTGEIRQKINYQDKENFVTVAKGGGDYFYTAVQTKGTGNVLSEEYIGQNLAVNSENANSSERASFLLDNTEGGNKDDNQSSPVNGNYNEKNAKNIQGSGSKAIDANLAKDISGKEVSNDSKILASMKNYTSDLLPVLGAVCVLAGFSGVGLAKLRKKIQNKHVSKEIVEVEIEK
jgi:hypothetical protein